LCYFPLLIIFIWDRVYYIIKKKGNEPKYYFISLKPEKCLHHKSYTCNCKITQKDNFLIANYIIFYRFYYNIIIYSHGNIKNVIKEKKELLKFIIE
ncbi:hypothetical protein BCR36DRAFT_280467, partial [Piromyces finnis]